MSTPKKTQEKKNNSQEYQKCQILTKNVQINYKISLCLHALHLVLATQVLLVGQPLGLVSGHQDSSFSCSNVKLCGRLLQ